MSPPSLGSASRARFTRFGVTLADFDNDGLLDLFEANGKVSAPSASVTHDEQSEGTIFDEPNVLLRGMPGGRFEELSPRGGVPEPLEHTSRGLAVGDVNDDGGLDLLIINRDAPAIPAAEPRPRTRQLDPLPPRPGQPAKRRLRRHRLRSHRRPTHLAQRPTRRQLPRLQRPPPPLRPRHRNRSGSRNRPLARRNRSGTLRRLRRRPNSGAQARNRHSSLVASLVSSYCVVDVRQALGGEGKMRSSPETNRLDQRCPRGGSGCRPNSSQSSR